MECVLATLFKISKPSLSPINHHASRRPNRIGVDLFQDDTTSKSIFSEQSHIALTMLVDVLTDIPFFPKFAK